MIAIDDARFSGLASRPGNDLNAPHAPRASVEPGDKVPIRFPMRATGGTNGEDVIVRFDSLAGRCEPSEVNLGPMPVGAEKEATTTLTIAPLNGKREATVWVNVLVGESVFRSEALAIPISARSRLVMSANEDRGTTTITITNTGNAPATTTLELYGTEGLASDTLDLLVERPGLTRSDRFIVPVDETLTFVVHDGTIDHIIATATDGERASASPTQLPAPIELGIVALLTFDAPESGVRRGEAFTSVLTLTNRNPQPIDDLIVTLSSVDGADLLWDSITLDQTHPIGSDITNTTAGGTAIRIGRLSANTGTRLEFDYRLIADDPRTLDALRIAATINARNSEEKNLLVDVPIDRRPAFAPSTTYLGSIMDYQDRYAVQAIITNAEPRRIESLRVRFELLNAIADTTATASFDNRRETLDLHLRPTAMTSNAATFVDVGSLDPGDRVTIRLGLRPVRGMNDHTVMKVRSIFIADSMPVILGASERRVAARVDLSTSSLVRTDDNPLRLAMPVEAQLDIRNTGIAPAHDVRIAVDLPPFMGASLPDAPNGGRWRTFLKSLYPGTATSAIITFYLTEPPTAPTVHVPVYIDAAGQSGFTLATLTFSTPSASLIDPPIIHCEAREDGYLEFNARIANYGDGPARGVTVSVTDASTIVLRSTAVDATPVPDRGARSILETGLGLRDLPPGTYRDVSWLVAPLDDEPYRTTVEVRYAGGTTVRATSIPTRRRQKTSIDSSLPTARKMLEEQELAEGRRRIRVVNDDLRYGVTGGETQAIGAGFGQTTSFALPTPESAPPTYGPAADDFAAVSPVELPPSASQRAISAPNDARQNTHADGWNELPELATPEPLSTSAAQQPALTEAAPLPEDDVAREAETTAGDAGALAAAHAGADADAGTDHAGLDRAAGRAEAAAEDDFYATVDEPAAAAPPNDLPPPLAPYVAAPIEIHGALDAPGTRLALRMAREMLESPNLGWWRHVMFVRAMIQENAPVSRHTDAWNALRNAVVRPVKSLYPRTLAPEFQVTEAFVDALDQYADDAVAALKTLAIDPNLGLTWGTATGASIVDTALPSLLPKHFGVATFDAQWTAYYEAVGRIFNYPNVVELQPAERYAHHGVPNATLDHNLRNLLDVIP